MTSVSAPRSVGNLLRLAFEWTLIVAAVGSTATMVRRQAGDRGLPDGWTTAQPRDELRPKFSYDPRGGRDGKGAFAIAADGRDGLDGWWTKAVPVKGGSHYRFHAARKTDGVSLPRQSALVRIVWQDDKGHSVALDAPTVAGYLKGWKSTAEPEFPTDKQTDGSGWTEVSDTYHVPSKATRAVIELHLQWPPPGGRIEWSEVSFEETSPPAGRKSATGRCAFPAERQVRDCQLRRGPAAHRTGRKTKRRLDRSRRNSDLLRPGQVPRRNRRAGAWPHDRILRCIGQETQPLHRAQRL